MVWNAFPSLTLLCSFLDETCTPQPSPFRHPLPPAPLSPTWGPLRYHPPGAVATPQPQRPSANLWVGECWG